MQWHGAVLPTVWQLPARPGTPAASANALEANGAVTSGKSPMLVHVMPTGLSDQVFPHEPVWLKQNWTHGASKKAVPTVLQ
jgi:hypothetical protein